MTGGEGPQTFTLEGADHAYRVLIESMNEGALTLTPQGMILYSNQRFAVMVQCPLKQVIGSSFQRFLPMAQQSSLSSMLKKRPKSGSTMQTVLQGGGSSTTPVQVSIRRVTGRGSRKEIIGMVVTDMTEAQRAEGLMRELSHRLLQAQEVERGRIARELHDHITQLLCAIFVRSQTLVVQLSRYGKPTRSAVIALRRMAGQAADEVERISRNLRPGVLEELGLEVVLRQTAKEFEHRTKVGVELSCSQLTLRLPADTELALYRILQEALKNVEEHARAHKVMLALRQRSDLVELTIEDDGVGFHPAHQAPGRTGAGGLGLLSMRERANYARGTLTIRSSHGAGTEVGVTIPLHPGANTPKRSIR
jgi:two-component system NarL family sensor kinase